jgi:hypothetical protein
VNVIAIVGIVIVGIGEIILLSCLEGIGEMGADQDVRCGRSFQMSMLLGLE